MEKKGEAGGKKKSLIYPIIIEETQRRKILYGLNKQEKP